MSWTDYSSTTADGYSEHIGKVQNSTKIFIDTSTPPLEDQVYVRVDVHVDVNRIGKSYNLPGFDVGYQPLGVANPIAGDLGGGTGGSGAAGRPPTGFLFPRGYGSEA